MSVEGQAGRFAGRFVDPLPARRARLPRAGARRPALWWWLIIAALLMADLGLAHQLSLEPSRPGTLVIGEGHAVLQLPPGTNVVSYRNDGYEVEVMDREAAVSVDLKPFGTSMPFAARDALETGALRPDDELRALAWRLTAESRNRYQASSSLLSWVARSVRYRLDRSLPQDAVATLRRRSGYCTGIASLTVALHRAVGIPAREVAGLVFDDVTPGYHRWVEVELAPDRWVFSDPLRFHHFVSPLFVPLGSEKVHNSEPKARSLVLSEHDGIEPFDVYPQAPTGVSARAEDSRRRFASVRIVRRESTASTRSMDLPQEQGDSSRWTLEGPRWRRHLPASRSAGSVTFVGLEPGSYQLWLERAEAASAKRASKSAGDASDRTWRRSGPVHRIEIEATETREVLVSRP